jgi:hypothetical protein
MDEAEAVAAVERTFPGARVVDDAVCHELTEVVRKGHEGILDHVTRGQKMPTSIHVWAPCDRCDQASMVGITRGRARGRDPWPACRVTPHCEGRHVPQ